MSQDRPRPRRPSGARRAVRHRRLQGDRDGARHAARAVEDYALVVRDGRAPEPCLDLRRRTAPACLGTARTPARTGPPRRPGRGAGPPQRCRSRRAGRPGAGHHLEGHRCPRPAQARVTRSPSTAAAASEKGPPPDWPGSRTGRYPGGRRWPPWRSRSRPARTAAMSTLRTRVGGTETRRTPRSAHIASAKASSSRHEGVPWKYTRGRPRTPACRIPEVPTSLGPALRHPVAPWLASLMAASIRE